MPTPARTHLPIKAFIASSNILDEDAARDNEADIALLRLPAPGLRGTFAQAYQLLTRLVSQLGWDELLRTRSSVFVMEEEYRKHKSSKSVEAAMAAKELSASGAAGNTTDDDSSTRAMRSPAPIDTSINGGESRQELEVPDSAIPTIKISSESDREREHALMAKHARGESIGVSPVKEESEAEAKAEAEAEAQAKAEVEVPQIEKPEHAQHATTAADESEESPSSKVGDEDLCDDNVPSFGNKRLCERWLDNLFMVLYEDLRVYTIWRAEISHFKTQHMSYRKTGTEWEILGELAQRLHHREEAKDAFQRCLDSKFSAKAWMKVLEYYAEEGDLERSVNAAIRLTTYQHRWYMESSYPTLIAHYLFKLGQTHGHAKIQYTLLSKNLPAGIMEIMQGYLKYGQTFKVDGFQF